MPLNGSTRRPQGHSQSQHHQQHHGQHPYHRSNHQSHGNRVRDKRSRVESLQDALKSDTLLSKEDFLRVGRPTDSDTDAAYEAYVKQHQRAFLVRFVSLHGSDPWLTALYEGNASGKSVDDNDKGIQARLEWFCKNVDSPCLDLSRHEEDIDRRGFVEGRMLQLAPGAQLPASVCIQHPCGLRQLYINNIPPNASSADLLGVIRQSVPHAKSMVLSNPVPSKGFTRSGWLTLDPMDPDIDDSYPEVRLLDGLVFSASPLSVYPKDKYKRIKLVSGKFGSAERVKKDLWISQELITSMNVSRNIAFDLSEFARIKDEKQRLDLQIMFLRIVHWVCYYSAYEAACPEELVRHCGDIVLRDSNDSEDSDDDDLSVFDKKIQLLIDRGYRSLGLRPVSIEERLEEKFVQQLEKEKFKCTECAKLFKGPEFVVKHLKLKHEDMVTKESSSLILLNQVIELPHFLLIPNSMIVRPAGAIRRLQHTQSRSYNVQHTFNHTHHHHHKQQQKHQSFRSHSYVDLDAPSNGSSVEISYDL